MESEYLDLDSDERSLLEDLQLAAELGKNLLARNKELENSLKQYQNIVEEQAQEIEYLSKQTTALRKTNDNRIEISEQLEVSIQELERANQRLALDNSTDKKQIKSLCAYRDTLEARCEELQKALDEARAQQQQQQHQQQQPKKGQSRSGKSLRGDLTPSNSVESEHPGEAKSPTDDDDLVAQNQELKKKALQDQKTIRDLEEKMSRLNQSVSLLEEELCQAEEYVKSLKLEISSLESVGSGKLCRQCMKDMEHVQMLNDLEEDEYVERFPCSETASVDIKPGEDAKDNEPYSTDMESLLGERSRERRRSSGGNCLSLQDELKLLGELNTFNAGGDKGDKRSDDKRSAGKRNPISNTPTDFSEAETSSSGFSDSLTSNKATQTERNLTPGSFLCSIATGEDCKFSIYDDACPIDSRFRKMPGCRSLFQEIFAVLKSASEMTDGLSRAPNAAADGKAADVKPEPSPAAPTPRDSTNDFLQYVNVSSGIRKKPHRRGKRDLSEDGASSGDAGSTPKNSPRRSGRRQRGWKSSNDSPRTQSPVVGPHVLTTLDRRASRNAGTPPTPWGLQPFVSTAAQEVARLKKLEKSYAEVLRQPPKTFSPANRKGSTSLMK